MKKLTFGLVAGLALGLTALATEPVKTETGAAPEQLFERATGLLLKEQWAEDAVLLEQANTRSPDDPAILANLGIALAELERHEDALKCWQTMQRLEPGNWTHTAKVVQALQGLKRWKERDEAIERVRAERKKSKDPALASRPWFCREQFRHHGRKVMVVDYFEPAKEFAVFTAFLVLAPDGRESFRLSLGSYDATTEIARASGEVGPRERMYHLDYYAPNEHRTYRMYPQRPPYDHVRASVIAVLDDEEKPKLPEPAGPSGHLVRS